jgi:hypothetical protein
VFLIFSMAAPQPAMQKPVQEFAKAGHYFDVLKRFSYVDSVADLVEAMAQEPDKGSQRPVRDTTHFPGTAACYGLEEDRAYMFLVNGLDVLFSNNLYNTNRGDAPRFEYNALDNPGGLRLQTIHPWLPRQKSSNHLHNHAASERKIDHSKDIGQTVLKVSIPELAVFDEGCPYFNAGQRQFLTALYGNPALMGKILMEETAAGRENLPPETVNKGRVTWISLPSSSSLQDVCIDKRLVVYPAWMNSVSGNCGIELYKPPTNDPLVLSPMLNTGYMRGTPKVQRVKNL